MKRIFVRRTCLNEEEAAWLDTTARSTRRSVSAVLSDFVHSAQVRSDARRSQGASASNSWQNACEAFPATQQLFRN